MTIRHFAVAMGLWLTLPLTASASCGAAFCSTNTNWDVQGVASEPGIRLDLRHEYIRQNQPRTGTRRLNVGEIPRHHDEINTTNRNWLGSIDYTVNEDWAFNAMVPLVDRQHDHIHNHRGTQLSESWNSSEIGDARIVARRRLASSENAQAHLFNTFGINLGLKLPTGSTDVRNGDGASAERSLQPGTGTTDLIVGGYYAQQLPMEDLSWFVQALAQVPLNEHKDYRPGRRMSFDGGLRYSVTDRASLMLQVNFLHRSRDRGAQAEPEDTGGRSVFLSPGASYALTKELQVYGFFQLPVYQSVNGVQLTAKRALVLGLSTRF